MSDYFKFTLPFDGSITLSASEYKGSGINQVTLYDSSKQEISTITGTLTTNLTAGDYYVKVENTSGINRSKS
jgi:hypothetical protein